MKKFLADIRQGQAPELPDSDLLTRASEKAEGKSRTKLEKRASKNAPIEITSKRSVGRRRDVVELPKNKTRDPRFDPLAGKLNEGLFNQSYGFLRDYQQDEIEDLRKKVVVEKDVDSKTKMERNLKRLESQMLARQKKEKRQEIVRDWRKKEAELVQKGKKPWQLKQSDIKKLELIDRYQHMKKKDLDKLLEKRRKKNASKEKRFLPYARRSAAE
ncbi:hypothetical protein DFS34DRAFT_584596 [Phlyctochytrium arcticum]|nr:hypothetical protein DFS34DRAFT_584596 [Phlyctochytrium arcticum]